MKEYHYNGYSMNISPNERILVVQFDYRINIYDIQIIKNMKLIANYPSKNKNGKLGVTKIVFTSDSQHLLLAFRDSIR